MSTESTEPIKVLWLIKGLGPGGAEKLLVSSAQVVDQKSFRYRAAFIRPDKEHLVPDLEQRGVPARLLGGSRRSLPARIVPLRGVLATTDIVHVHSPLLAGVTRIVARTLPRRMRPAVVTTEHNVWGSFSAPTRLLNAWTCRLDDHRFAVSREVLESMSPRAASRTEVLRHGIAEPASPVSRTVRSEVREELGIPDSAAVAITVANLRREKDYPNLMAAARIALREDPNLVFLAIGQGPLEAEVRAMHDSLGLGERFRLLGYRPDVARLLAASDIFVLGSLHEGLPVAIMEALAAGLPIVATAVGGVPEAVVEGVTGLLVPAQEPPALAAGVLGLSRDPVRRASMGAAARKSATRFDITHAVRREEDVYRALINERSPWRRARAGRTRVPGPERR